MALIKDKKKAIKLMIAKIKHKKKAIKLMIANF